MDIVDGNGQISHRIHESFWADTQQVNSIKCTKWKLISVARQSTYIYRIHVYGRRIFMFSLWRESPKGNPLSGEKVKRRRAPEWPPSRPMLISIGPWSLVACRWLLAATKSRAARGRCTPHSTRITLYTSSPAAAFFALFCVSSARLMLCYRCLATLAEKGMIN